MVAMGAGLGVGLGAGNVMGNMAAGNISTCIQSPSLPNIYHVYIDGQQLAGQTIETMSALVLSGRMTVDTLVWTPGLSAWKRAGDLDDLHPLFDMVTPPPLPM